MPWRTLWQVVERHLDRGESPNQALTAACAAAGRVQRPLPIDAQPRRRRRKERPR